MLTLPLARGMSSRRSASLQGMGSTKASPAVGEGEDINSTPKYAWTSQDNDNHPTTDNKTTVAGVVAGKLFHRAKFVDQKY
jgi:hypothetical protein